MREDYKRGMLSVRLQPLYKCKIDAQSLVYAREATTATRLVATSSTSNQQHHAALQPRLYSLLRLMRPPLSHPHKASTLVQTKHNVVVHAHTRYVQVASYAWFLRLFRSRSLLFWVLLLLLPTASAAVAFSSVVAASTQKLFIVTFKSRGCFIPKASRTFSNCQCRMNQKNEWA